MDLPSYDDLPACERGGRSAWGLFGATDNIGLVNLQTPDRVAAAAREIQRGAVFALSAEVAMFDPPMFGRAATRHRIISTPGDPGLDDALDDFNPQASSQWDSLAHVPYASDAFYNGASKDDVMSGRRNSISHWARRGIVGRAVLLDVPGVLGAASAGYSPGAAMGLTVDDLERCRAAAGVDYEPGDVLLLHTGFAAWYLEQDPACRQLLADEANLTAAGVEHSEDMARYLWDSHICALVSDNPAVEVCPIDWRRESRPFGFLHRMLIAQFGMALGELWWLDDLARDCREDGRYTAFYSSAPLNIAAGISSPPNAVAIK
jgi:kynurenine formamidase